MTHWTEKRRACALLGQALRRAGWTLLGWKDDKSDAMTDYWDPASWDGVATLDVRGERAVVVVDCGRFRGCGDHPRTSGLVPESHKLEPAGTCSTCSGSGIDPSGWTLEAARAEPRRYHRETAARGEVALLPDVVSPIPFRGDGRLKCRRCHGRGHDVRTVIVRGDPWPTHTWNPKGSSWHVEIGGRIIASGSGVYSALRAPEGEAEFSGKSRAPERFDLLASRITAAAEFTNRAAADTAAATPDVLGGAGGAAWTVRASSVRADFVEIVFNAKPADDVRTDLKRCGFRWSGRSGCWYGPATRLPAAFAAAPAAQEA